MPFATYLSTLVLGLLGGVHCAGMCGGFVAAASAAPSQRLHAGRVAMWLYAVPLHAGRIATYSLAGAVVGALGEAFGRLPVWLPVQTSMFALANVGLIALGLGFALRGSGLPLLDRLGARVFGSLAPLARWLAGWHSALRRFLLGMVWGLVPCGMVYGVLALALLAGDALNGAALAFAFGLGTLPNLLAAGWLLAALRRWTGSWAGRGIVGFVLLGFGLAGLLRASALSAQFSSALFCLSPH
jgi:uncharacterized protein